METKRMRIRSRLWKSVLITFSSLGFLIPAHGTDSVVEELKNSKEELGRPADGSIKLIQTRIKQRYGYEVHCDKGFWTGISDYPCLAGLKRIFHSLESGGMPPNPELIGITNIRVAGSGKWHSNRYTYEGTEITVPFDSKASDLERYVNFTLENPKRQTMIRTMQNLQRREKMMKSQLNFKLGWEQGLFPEELVHGLSVLSHSVKSLKAEGMEEAFRNSTIDTVILANQNTPVFEKNGRLHIEVNVHDSVSEMKDFIRNQIEVTPRQQPPAAYGGDKDQLMLSVREFNLNKNALNQLHNHWLKRYPSSQLSCGEHGNLEVGRCLEGLRNLNSLEKIVPNQVQKLNRVIIQDSSLFRSSANLVAEKDGTHTLYMEYNAKPVHVAEDLLKAKP